MIWTATLVSNIGWWMYTAASAWLMVRLNPAPLVVSLVQVANTLPMFLLAIPAGALTDIVDKRKFLIVGEIAIAVVATAFAVLVWQHLVTPVILLVFAFLVAAGDALTSPAYQAIVPMLVPRSEVPRAVVANSAGVNGSRAVGPALGGLLLGAFGIAAPFFINAVSNYGSIGALLWWREPERGGGQRLPPEHLWSAIRTGLRYARYNASLGATLIRSAGFVLFASAYWALLPLVAREKVHGGPTLYGLLLGTIGLAAIVGALALPRLRRRFGADRLVGYGMLGTALALFLFGIAIRPGVAFAASIVAGFAWMMVLAPLNISTQVVLPAWVRGRGLAIYATVMFGGLTIGSLIWGQIAASHGIRTALITAAVLLALAVPLARRWRLQTGADCDLSPSMQWPAPVITREVQPERGPVLVTVEYRIRPADRAAFLTAMEAMRRQRRRSGAYDWDIFEDTGAEGRFVETFRVDSWLEHLRQHQRVTAADVVLQSAANSFQQGGAPQVTHLVAAHPNDAMAANAPGQGA